MVLGCATLAAAQSEGERKAALADLPKLIAALDVREGQTVADIGAGWGWLTIGMARQVGPNGRVYGTDLGEKNVAELKAEVEKERLPQVTVIEGGLADTNLPEVCCDAVFTRFVYHHFAEPLPMNRSVLKSLKPGGRYAVIEFLPGRGIPEATDPKDRAGKAHGVGPDSVERELREAGFEIVSVSPVVDRGFMVVGRRPAR
jgi:ubiquinone/menaquinone biosynthesis C-methylase UbiE